MKKLFTLISLSLLSFIANAQANISYTYSTSGNCYPITITLNISSDNPDVSFFSVNSDAPFGSWQFVNAGDPYVFTVSSPQVNLSVGAYANGGLVGQLNDNFSVNGFTYALSASGAMPYSVAVGSPFPIQLTTNDTGVSSVTWDFGDGQTQNGGLTASPVYAQAGTYNVTCTINSADCGTIIRTLEITASNIQVSLPETICVGSEFLLVISGANPLTSYYNVNTPDGSYMVSALESQVPLIYYSNGLSYLEVYCYDADGFLIDLMSFNFNVSGVEHYITPNWTFVRVGEEVDYQFLAVDEQPIQATNITWSFGQNGANVSNAFSTAGFFLVKAYFTNTCNNLPDSVSATVLVSDAQVTVNTQACVPASFNVSHSGEDYFGIIGMLLWNNDGVEEWFEGVDEFDFNFTQAGDYNVTVSYSLGDAMGDLTFPIYISGTSAVSATATACGSYVFGSEILTTSGTYTLELLTAAGCDSIVTLNLTIEPELSVAITNNQGTLTATGGGTTFKWFNCTTGEFIPGATSATFIPNQSGFYGVVATSGECSDSTEVCVEVTGLNLGELANQTVQMYPNPTQGNVTISNAVGSTGMIFDARGKMVHSFEMKENEEQINLNQFEAGIYLVNITLSNGKTEQQRLVVVK